jgi:hypothetical protein
MDLTKSIEPKSDQLNADDIIAGPVTVTIDRVTEGSVEQPVDVHLVEFPGRPYRPSKSMRRVMVSAWGKEAAEYAGRRMTLYRDPEVTFGRDKVGGVKISHLSHIEKRMSLALTVTRGKRSPHVVEPLTDAATTVQQITPDHERVIGEHIKRTGMTREGVLTAAREIATGPVTSARELTAAQADELIAFLASRPDAGTDPFPNVPTDDGDQSFPAGGAA